MDNKYRDLIPITCTKLYAFIKSDKLITNTSATNYNKQYLQ